MILWEAFVKKNEDETFPSKITNLVYFGPISAYILFRPFCVKIPREKR